MMVFSRSALPLVIVLAVASATGTEGSSARRPDPTVEFNRDIRPILSDKCFACHGPDENKRMSPLRLDTPDGALADLGGRFAIVPGDAEGSGLINRVNSGDSLARMPPSYSGKSLSDHEKELLRSWIDQGAHWQNHWSFRPPVRSEPPTVSDPEWVRNPIDRFVLARLEGAGLKPSSEADPAALIRRASLDLTGFPPEPEVMDRFLEDPTDEAYERAVDRLLNSPRYGERMAIRWLDAARYADTNGYQTDAERSMWRWRDWVIDAFNRNLPFDDFTVEQVAGDMLPDATLDQRIASAFNRNHRGNGEGGIIPEEYRVEYVVDRVETTSTVWLGLTMGCARCHDHKYDPLTQREFYEMFAYFNNVPEKGRAFKYGNSPPFIPAPTDAQQRRLKELEAELAGAKRKFEEHGPELDRLQRSWEEALTNSNLVNWSLRDNLEVAYSLDGHLTADTPGVHPPKARLLDGVPHFVPGPVGTAASFDNKRYVDAGTVAAFEVTDRFTLAAWVRPETSEGAILSKTQSEFEGEGQGSRGYGLFLRDGKLQLNLVVRWLDDSLRVETVEALKPGEWRHVAATYDASFQAKGIRIYIDGKPAPVRVLLDFMNQNFYVKDPLRIGAAGPKERFRGQIDDIRIYRGVVPPERIAVLATSRSLDRIARIPQAERTPGQTEKLRLGFVDQYAPVEIQDSWRRVLELAAERKRLVQSFPTVMVMQERTTPRETFILDRGAYDSPTERVEPGVPALFPGLRNGAPANRLEFARWLVDPSNPLTARVTVNRFWQMYFGQGLVRTAENFGSQGEWPTHPLLLDWLATEFMDSGWDVKALQRAIVLSATYRQSSQSTPELRSRDPQNRLLARGPRFRLPAEVIRDQALFLARLLVEKQGGASVKPYQPDGLWQELTSGQVYKQSEGEDLYRRSLYTYWKRTIAPPFMLTFDASGREACAVLETRTNTPLQALNLMNDVTYVEAARFLAQRMMLEGGASPGERIGFAYRLATGRRPDARREAILLESYHHHRANYEEDRKAALQLVSQGERPRNPELDLAELASYTTVASLILNLDETISKE